MKEMTSEERIIATLEGRPTDKALSWDDVKEIDFKLLETVLHPKLNKEETEKSE